MIYPDMNTNSKYDIATTLFKALSSTTSRLSLLRCLTNLRRKTVSRGSQAFTNLHPWSNKAKLFSRFLEDLDEQESAEMWILWPRPKHSPPFARGEIELTNSRFSLFTFQDTAPSNIGTKSHDQEIRSIGANNAIFWLTSLIYAFRCKLLSLCKLR